MLSDSLRDLQLLLFNYSVYVRFYGGFSDIGGVLVVVIFLFNAGDLFVESWLARRVMLQLNKACSKFNADLCQVRSDPWVINHFPTQVLVAVAGGGLNILPI